MKVANRKLLTRVKMQTEDKMQTADWVAWENGQRFAMPPLDPPQNDVWKTSKEIPCWWHFTCQIWVVLLIGKGTFLANQALYPDLGSVTSSVWNFCAFFSDVISWESQWWHLKILGCLLRLQTESTKRKKTARNFGLECIYQASNVLAEGIFIVLSYDALWKFWTTGDKRFSDQMCKYTLTSKQASLSSCKRWQLDWVNNWCQPLYFSYFATFGSPHSSSCTCHPRQKDCYNFRLSYPQDAHPSDLAPQWPLPPPHPGVVNVV